MIPASTIARLASLGLSAEQSAAVAQMMAEVEAATEAKAQAVVETESAVRRAKAAAKKRRQRAGLPSIVPGTEGDRGGQTGTEGDTPAPLLLSPRTPLITTPHPRTHTHTAPGARASAVADFEPSSTDVALLGAEGLGPADVEAELRPFRDHWLASNDPLPADLGAAFRGFCRHGRGRRKPARGGQGARASPAPQPVAEFVSVNGVKVTPNMVRGAIAAGQWPRSYGKPRGDRDCQIPPAWFEPALEPAE